MREVNFSRVDWLVRIVCSSISLKFWATALYSIKLSDELCDAIPVQFGSNNSLQPSQPLPFSTDSALWHIFLLQWIVLHCVTQRVRAKMILVPLRPFKCDPKLRQTLLTSTSVCRHCDRLMMVGGRFREEAKTILQQCRLNRQAWERQHPSQVSNTR